MFDKLTRKVSAMWEKSARLQAEEALPVIRGIQAELAAHHDANLRDLARRRAPDRAQCFALAAIAAERALGLKPFDVQIMGALAMADGKIAEMQTGEGKTLAAVLAVAWFVAQGERVHVLTANDYLARRDAEWMAPLYEYLGVSVGFVTQSMTPAERRRAYDCEVAYTTPNEAGFDYLRDGLALDPDDLVHHDLSVALIDEADSILIDEARIPLVIAGGDAPPAELVRRLAEMARSMQRGVHYSIAPDGRNVLVDEEGAALVERSFGCRNLYDERNLALYTAVCDALHAEALLRRDVDYLVRHGAIEIVDEFKGRVAELRRWPAGLQTALEAKEGLELRAQGRILGSITLQSFVKLYAKLCGMTGTASTQAREFFEVYGLAVAEIPTNRPVIRIDHEDDVFQTREARDLAVAEEIARAHAAGRPVLAGTASVADSERLSARLAMPHRVLNARNDTEEAAIVAKAGERGAVTISTNMAGRGTDIRLGEGVTELGGLYVIGTARHEARRIDHQLRGRAGRQGDPGESRFFLSLDDELMQRYGLGQKGALAIDHVQRVIEGGNLEIRKTLFKYDRLIESQRRAVYELRQQLLFGERECASPASALLGIDELWAGYLAEIAELKSGIHWVSFGGKDPFDVFIHRAQDLFLETERLMQEAVESAVQHADAESLRRGATWTYVTSDQPLGDMNQRLARGIVNKIRELVNPAQ